MSLSDVYEKVKPAVAAIAIMEKQGERTRFRIFGTGFCVDSDGIVVTARHVVAGYYEMVHKTSLPHTESEAKNPVRKPSFVVVFFRRESNRLGSITCPVIGINWLVEGEGPEYDEAELDIGKCPDIWGSQWPCLELAELSKIREGDEVATAGYPLKVEPIDGVFPDLSRGVVSRIDMKIGKGKNWETAKIALDMRINPGNSGGPVFDINTGKVLGVVSSERLRDPDGIPEQLRGLFKIPTGIVYCLPCGTGMKECISRLKSSRPNSATLQTRPGKPNSASAST